MEQKPAEPLKTRDTATELKAVIEARRELGPDMEDHLLASFLGRIESQVDARVSERLGKSAAKGGSGGHASKGEEVPSVAIAASTFALSIPLIAIAGGISGTIGILAVIGCLVIVNLLYLIDKWVHLNMR
jgi:hypothetical protein